MNTSDNKKTLREGVMESIDRGRVRMRPRWQFIVRTLLALLLALLVALVLLFFASLLVFSLRDTGMWFTPSFGARGWFELLRAFPWLPIVLLLIFVIVLEILVRRFAFVYRKPLIASLLGIVGVIAVVGFVLAPLHRSAMLSARQGTLPSPLSIFYSPPFRPVRPPDVYRGEIVSLAPGGFVLVDADGRGTTTIAVTPQTRLPYGSDFSQGEDVLVVGDRDASGTVEAFGVRDMSSVDQ